MGLKLEMNLLKRLVFILLCLYLICAEYEFETFGATRDEIRLSDIYIYIYIYIDREREREGCIVYECCQLLTLHSVCGNALN